MATPSPQSTVRCEDGTEIPFEWAYDDAPQYEWMRDRAHWPGPVPHMEHAIRQMGPPGGDRAWREVDMEPLAPFRRFQMVGPFMYARMTPYEPEHMARIGARYQEVARQYGGIQGFWERFCEPRIIAATNEIAAMPPDASLQTAAETWMYGFHQTFTSAAMLSEAQMRLMVLLAGEHGSDSMLLSYEATQGGDNASQDIDREIAALAEQARSTPSVARIVTSEGDDALVVLRSEPAARTFIDAFDALIARHGMRSLGWACQLPTWAERPEAPLALVRAQLESPPVTQEEMHAKSAAARAAATDRVLASLPADKHEAFKGIVREMEGYVPVREGRAYRQMLITGAMRLFLLRIGASLVDAGRVAAADDIFFLQPDDLAGTGSLHDTAAARRAEWERWSTLKLPMFIGTPGFFQQTASEAIAAWRGQPASRGVVTGTARILAGPEEGHRLSHGEILVCEMTTPAWTPLFAIAGGIVTETGGALSHPAITAREYGIPAVVALDSARSKIRDGQTITVNGGTGEVTLG